MRIAKVVSTLAAFMLLLILPTTILAAEPPRPSVFGGTATLDGAPAPDGTPVSAVIEGTEVAATIVENGAYAFTISQPPGESYSGKTITFLVGGAAAPESGTWEPDGGGVLNLAVLGGQTANTDQIPRVTVPVPLEPQTRDGGIAPKGSKRKAFVGVVDTKTGESVTLIQNGNKGPVTIVLDNPKIKTPGGPVAGTFTKDARVVIQVRNVGTKVDPVWVAIRVLVKPVKPTVTPFSGTVVSVTGDVVTIMQPDGSTTEIELEAGALPPEIGELVTGFAGSSPTEGANKGKKHAKAKGFVKASKIRARLEAFLDNLTTDEARVPEESEGEKVRSARQKAEARREKANAARAQADVARAKAEAAQGAEAADLNESAADAEENAVEAEVELAEAEAEVAEVQAEAVEEAAEAESDAAERRAERVSDVASILDALTARHTDILQSLAEGSILPEEALPGIAIALENAQRGRSQATLKAVEARVKSEDKKRKTRAKAKEKREKAQAKAVEKREKAQAKAAEKREKDLARAEKKRQKAQAKIEREAVKAKADQERETGKVKAEREREVGKAQAEQQRETGKANAEQERGAVKTRAEREREAARGRGR